tara:strand:+ start:5900 stop:7372 length:1473 start_codon:yes stop_codon:yes gene_type:complete
MFKRDRKFQDIETYRNGLNFFLLPFKFDRISDKEELLTSIDGQFIIVPTGTVESILEKDRSKIDEDVYYELLSKNFISTSSIPKGIDLIATRYRTKNTDVTSKVSLHIIVLTLRCDHTCHYCQVSRVNDDNSEFDIPTDYLKKSIDLIFKFGDNNITIEFQGGEPTLVPNLLKEAISYSLAKNKEYNLNINFVLCTNAAHVTDEILEICKTNNVLISTSLDGPKFIHDSNRFLKKKSSYENVISGINKYREHLGSDQVSALMTTTQLSLKHPKEIIDCYIENNFTNIFLRPISPYGFAIKTPKLNSYEIKDFIEFYKCGLEYIIDINRKGHFFVEDYTVILLRKMLTPFQNNYVDLMNPSAAGRSVLVYNYDGNIYAGDEGRMLKEMGDDYFKLSHVSEGKKALYLAQAKLGVKPNSSLESQPGCNNCVFSCYCGIDSIYHYATQGEIIGNKAISGFCSRHMFLFKYLIELMKDEENLKIFNSWINNRKE